MILFVILRKILVSFIHRAGSCGEQKINREFQTLKWVTFYDRTPSTGYTLGSGLVHSTESNDNRLICHPWPKFYWMHLSFSIVFSNFMAFFTNNSQLGGSNANTRIVPTSRGWWGLFDWHRFTLRRKQICLAQNASKHAHYPELLFFSLHLFPRKLFNHVPEKSVDDVPLLMIVKWYKRILWDCSVKSSTGVIQNMKKIICS